MVRRRYFAAIGLVGCLVIAGHSAAYWSLHDQRDDASLINIAGRQRMLSQRAAKAGHELYIGSIDSDPLAVTAAVAELRATVELLESSHEALLNGDAEAGVSRVSDRVAVDLLQALDTILADITASANRLIEAAVKESDLGSSNAVEIAHRTLSSRCDDFLPRMHRTVGSLEDAARSRNNRQGFLEVVLLIATLLALTLEIIFIFEPLTRKLRASHRKLDAINQRLERSIDMKTVVMRHVTHELRTPMTAILGYVDIMGDPQTSEEDQASARNTIKNAGEHLLLMINNLLDSAKIDASYALVEPRPCNISETICSALNLVRPLADQKGLAIEARVVDSIPSIIESDGPRLREVMINLLSNAIKYTDQGRITVLVKLESPQSDNAARLLRIDVQDTGIGMTSEEQSRVFTPFEQATGGRIAGGSSTGLGLTISREIVRQLGGELTLTSEPGVGTIFSATISIGNANAGSHDIRSLDFQRPLASRLTAQATLPLAGVRVLLAEDSEVNARLILHHLRTFGAVAEHVVNGREAVDRVSSPDSGFDIVLLDMHMPELDGVSAARQMRASGIQIPIAALTASLDAGEIRQCRVAGMDDHMGKPYQPEELVSLVLRLARPRDAKSAA